MPTELLPKIRLILLECAGEELWLAPCCSQRLRKKHRRGFTKCRSFASRNHPSSMPLCAHTLNNCTRQQALRSAAFISRQSLGPRRLPAQLRNYASISAAELQFGQPLHETHPHLLKAGERELKRLSSQTLLTWPPSSYPRYHSS